MPHTFDAIVVGTGQSGPALARDLAEAGRKVAIVERKDFGGSCVNFGCIPTKAYVASAQAAHIARVGADFGVEIRGEVSVDLAKVKQRKDRLVEESSEGVEDSLREHENITVFQGHGRFVGPRRIKVNGDELKAETVVLNVGARANVPKIEGVSSIPWLTSSDMLELTELPRHLVIIGGGYVGIEFAQMFARFGSAVTILQRGERVLPGEDDDVSDEVRRILEGEGITVRTGAEAAKLRRTDKGVGVTLKSGDEVEGTHLLIAAGRKPNTDDLGVGEAGVKLDERGYIRVNDHLQSSADGVLALGDCNGRGAFTHTSYHDYQVATDLLLGEGKRKVSDRIPCHAVYMDPPLGRVGMTEREAVSSGRKILAAKLPMNRVGRAKEEGETEGFMKVAVDAESFRILGAAILGLHGDEAIHCFADAMYADAPYQTLRDAVHIHPTVAELIPTLLQGLKPVEA